MDTNQKVIKIDGSILEGGGQLLRNSLSLCCILGKPLLLYNIRVNRSNPGLAAQHLKGVHLLRDLCNGVVKGDQIGSTKVEFYPNQIHGGSYFANIATAGSIALLIQIALPVCLFADGPVTLELKGGTNAAMAPQIEFVTEIFRLNLEKFDATFDFDLFRRGYFPKGGGHCKLAITPVSQLAPCEQIEYSQLEKIWGWTFVSGVLPLKIADMMMEGAKEVLDNTNVPLNIEAYKEAADMAEGNCSGIILGCETYSKCCLGSSALGHRQESAMDTGRKAANELKECLDRKACVDKYIQDQLIIYMALAAGTSKIRTLPLTLHTKTSMYIAETITNAKFTVTENSDGTCIIECKGIGFINNNNNAQ